MRLSGQGAHTLLLAGLRGPSPVDCTGPSSKYHVLTEGIPLCASLTGDNRHYVTQFAAASKPGRTCVPGLAYAIRMCTRFERVRRISEAMPFDTLTPYPATNRANESNRNRQIELASGLTGAWDLAPTLVVAGHDESSPTRMLGELPGRLIGTKTSTAVGQSSRPYDLRGRTGSAAVHSHMASH
ncbi:hypothetical protein [Dactylosporangium sp. NPDC051484]|uniref:hypothetical protein n=1 Tax=Dactylosporangium sp. NPDC051484 TaxID=3154942 RepID=UPI00344D22ED